MVMERSNGGVTEYFVGGNWLPVERFVLYIDSRRVTAQDVRYLFSIAGFEDPQPASVRTLSTTYTFEEGPKYLKADVDAESTGVRTILVIGTPAQVAAITQNRDAFLSALAKGSSITVKHGAPIGEMAIERFIQNYFPGLVIASKDGRTTGGPDATYILSDRKGGPNDVIVEVYQRARQFVVRGRDSALFLLTKFVEDKTKPVTSTHVSSQAEPESSAVPVSPIVQKSPVTIEINLGRSADSLDASALAKAFLGDRFRLVSTETPFIPLDNPEQQSGYVATRVSVPGSEYSRSIPNPKTSIRTYSDGNARVTISFVEVPYDTVSLSGRYVARGSAIDKNLRLIQSRSTRITVTVSQSAAPILERVKEYGLSFLQSLGALRDAVKSDGDKSVLSQFRSQFVPAPAGALNKLRSG